MQCFFVVIPEFSSHQLPHKFLTNFIFLINVWVKNFVYSKRAYSNFRQSECLQLAKSQTNLKFYKQTFEFKRTLNFCMLIVRGLALAFSTARSDQPRVGGPETKGQIVHEHNPANTKRKLALRPTDLE
jgi:hypothetical protein